MTKSNETARSEESEKSEGEKKPSGLGGTLSLKSLDKSLLQKTPQPSAKKGKVVVEHKRRRLTDAPVEAQEQSKREEPLKKPSLDTAKKTARPSAPPAFAAGGDSHLSKEEQEARLKALEAAKSRFEKEDEARKERQLAEDAAKALLRQQQEEEAAALAEKQEPAPQSEESRPETKEREIETPAPRQPSGTVEVKKDFVKKPAGSYASAAAAKPKPKRGRGEEENRDAAAARKTLAPSGGGRDRSRKLTVTAALDDEGREERGPSMAAFRRRLNRIHHKSKDSQETVKIYREVIIPETITVQELANRMAEKSAIVVKELMKLGIMATINKVLDADTAELIVTTLGHTSKRVSEADVDVEIGEYVDDPAMLKPRPPVVTVMGHVDHGKTSLLDALRKTHVTSAEAGGITQHIGAYQVNVADRGKVTFIDTPGHAAFGAMRARGAKVTDIVILVVAADDGVKPQTIEAISHAKAAEAPIIVAINKMDKPGADPHRVRTELLSHEIVTESMGGDILEVEISALKGTNLDKLLDAVLLQAEMLDLKANPDRPGEGVVIEAKLDKGRGAVGTLLIQHGSVNIGDIVIAGASWGRVRAINDEKGARITTAGPSQPVEIQGLNDAPMAGDHFLAVENENRAREITEYRARKIKDNANLAVAKTLDTLMSQIKSADKKDMPVLIKGDVHGSVEAINTALQKLGNDEVGVRVIHSAVGGVNESDIHLAETAGGIVIGFNVRANKQAADLAERRKIEIRYYAIIYDLIDDIKAALSGMLKPELREEFLGNAEILQVFDITKVGKVAGCIIRKGMAARAAKVRLIRDNTVIHEGTLSTLRRFKDEVKEVKEGYECGMAFENYHDIRVGDMIEIFEIREVKRFLQ